mmetsp:Transcript_1515/g.3023  ORF Transcript_1515/g.3023 Transcript_1515/m.3023 type:complete len:351 (-) Transcript_1515:36-1088(-)
MGSTPTHQIKKIPLGWVHRCASSVSHPWPVVLLNPQVTLSRPPAHKHHLPSHYHSVSPNFQFSALFTHSISLHLSLTILLSSSPLCCLSLLLRGINHDTLRPISISSVVLLGSSLNLGAARLALLVGEAHVHNRSNQGKNGREGHDSSVVEAFLTLLKSECGVEDNGLKSLFSIYGVYILHKDHSRVRTRLHSVRIRHKSVKHRAFLSTAHSDVITEGGKVLENLRGIVGVDKVTSNDRNIVVILGTVGQTQNDVNDIANSKGHSSRAGREYIRSGHAVSKFEVATSKFTIINIFHLLLVKFTVYTTFFHNILHFILGKRGSGCHKEEPKKSKENNIAGSHGSLTTHLCV